MAAFLIEGENTTRLELLVNLAKELGLSVREHTAFEPEPDAETRFKKGIEEANDIQSGKQEGVDAYKFLDGL